MCWSEQLYDAMIHVYNSGMHDYTTPLIELLLQLRGTLKKGKTISGETHAMAMRLQCLTSWLPIHMARLEPRNVGTLPYFPTPHTHGAAGT